MPADFEVIRFSDTEKNRINAEIWNVSKQGKSECQGTEKWLLPAGLSDYHLYLDSKLRNIWGRTSGGGLFCLRAEGVDQEVIDCGHFSDRTNNRDLFLVRGTGKGTSQLCIIYADGNISKINFGESGYSEMEKYSLADVVESVVESRTIENPKNPWLSWKPNKQQDCRMQHPNVTSWQVGKFELHLNPRVPGGSDYEYFYIDWSFEDGLVENTGTPSEEMLNDKLEPIKLPGGVQASHGSPTGSGKMFAFTSNASSFGKKVVGIRPFGNNPPETRFPRTTQELEFEAETKTKIFVLESEIKELREMIRNLEQSP